jgi:hypothetical protein
MPRQAALALVESLADDMAERWRRGERPVVEDYLAAHTALGEAAEAVLELLSEEIALRQEVGEEVPATELLRRFPRWPAQVRALLGCHHLLAALPGPGGFPAAGERLGEFALLTQIGRGAHARVYLARQSSLADRLVVLKVVPRNGREHLCLARLQHTHIVPLYSVHDFAAQGVRALCLPYFGGATLDRLLAELASRPAGRRSGRDLLDALRRSQEHAQAALPVGGPACRFLARASWVQAVCWLGACLADALHYAHERGLAHLDLKSANVLLAADGLPMLLDFHLARGPLDAGAAAPDWLGGTPGYMAPEQHAALRAVAEGMPLPVALDGRADLYALGRLLCELLAGRLPGSAEDAVRAAREANRGVTRGLAALLRRCLAPLPAGRHASAADLAADLRMHIGEVPAGGLRGRWARWRGACTGLLLVVLLGLAAAGGAARLRRHSEPEHGEAERALAASELHRFCETIRPLYGSADAPPEQTRRVVAQCRRMWDKKDLINESFGRPSGPPCALGDLLDLAILYAHLRLRLPDSETAQARREALAVLDEAEALVGASAVLERERASLARTALGREHELPALPER